MDEVQDQFATMMNRSLGGMLNGNFSTAVQDAFRPLLEEAFRRGVRVGSDMSKHAIDAMLIAVSPDGTRQAVTVEVKSYVEGVRRRSPPGAVRSLVELILQDAPGSRVRDIQNMSQALDATISQSSVSNELNRHRGIRYRQEGRGWFLIGETEQVKPSADSLSYGAEPAVEGTDRAAA
jgi:hypothetical protein